MCREKLMVGELEHSLRNPVREKIAAGGVASSMTLRMVAANDAVMIACTAGFDSLYVDLEHSGLSMQAAGNIATMALAAGIACFVRVPANTPEYISRVLDVGALGIIAPGARSAAEARAVVDAAKYPPIGSRGVSGALPHFRYRPLPAAQALPALNAATMVIVQFESAASLERAEEIVEVEGVDMVLIGTNDLLADMGLPGQFDHEKVREAYLRTIEICRRHGKHLGVGGLGSRPDLVETFVRAGARYVSTGTDIQFLLEAATKRAQQVAAISV